MVAQAKDLHRVATDGMNRGKDQLDKTTKEVCVLTIRVKKTEQERDSLGREVQKREGNAKLDEQLMGIKEDVVKEFHRALDPTNTFNPGIGKTAKTRRNLS